MSEQAVAAKADMEAIRPINVVTWKDKLAAYKKRPLSMFLLMAVTVSAVITVGVLGALVIYILANGIMNLSPELLPGNIQPKMYRCFLQLSIHFL